MNRPRMMLSTLALGSVLTFSGAASAKPSAPSPQDLVQTFAAACQAQGAHCDASAASAFGAASLTRHSLTAHVAEYRIEVHVGPGPADVIGLHRVVREIAPYLPVPSQKSVMMVHGDLWDFDAAFLAAGATPAAEALPVYLAERGVDVWGIDLGWTRIPEGTSDLSFLSDWGFARDTHDIRIALGVARSVRLLGGSGAARMHLLGWSRGGMLTYAYAAAESQLPASMRHVGGIIPVDLYLKTDVESRRLDACARYLDERALIDAGSFANDSGALISTIGGLALRDPTGASPLFPGLDNQNAGMLAGAATYQLMPLPPMPSYHMTAGLWDTSGALTDLVHTDRAAWFDLTSHGRPYEPWALIAESDAITCDDPAIVDLPFDDHFGDVTVPVFYVGAGGGFGASGLHTTTLLGSSDVTSHVVELFPEEERLLDVGHADIFHGAGADALFWAPIHAWIAAH